MKRRYTLDSEDQLTDRDGYPLGTIVGADPDGNVRYLTPLGGALVTARITALTLEVVGDKGGKATFELTTTSQGRSVGESTDEKKHPLAPSDDEPQVIVPADEPTDVAQVWVHYVNVMEPRDATLHPAERKLVHAALKVATVRECCVAIDGCAASDFHMGHNEKRRKYNKLSNILKGKQGKRTLRENIDFFIDLAGVTAQGDSITSVLREKVDRCKREIMTWWEHPASDLAGTNGKKAERWLEEHGWQVEWAEPRRSARPKFIEPGA